MRRLLIVAAERVEGPELREAVSERVAGTPAEVRVVAPALTKTVLEQAMGDVDDAIVAARERLERSLEEVRAAGVDAEGEVGDSDLRLAIQDALQTFPADEILIVAHRDDPPRLETQGIEEAERSFEPRITELYVTGGDAGEPHIAATDTVAAGRTAEDPGEIEGRSGNLPPFSPRDVLGIGVAIVGTLVLVVLAASCDTVGFAEGFDACAVRLLLAGALGLINIAHVVGLTLFQAGPYRGFWRDFFADASLYGTPAAIIVSAVIG